MKSKLFIIIIALFPMISFGQTNPTEVLEPVSYARACLEAAIIPPPDTVDCYPEASKKWLVLINQYVKDLSEKLNEDARKGLEAANKEWAKVLEKELQETNQIIQDKTLSLPTRRQAAVRQFKFIEKRALNLRKALAN